MIRLSIFLLAFYCMSFSSALSQIQNPSRVDPRWKTDTSLRIIELNEIKALLDRDVFPVFNDPSFVGKNKGLEIYYEREPVIVIEIEGKSKAYPMNVLTFHELANDRLSDVPILVSYCPLCNSAVVFDRTLLIGGIPTELNFGVSGMLRKSDMIMWDKETETWWQQFTGEAIVGKLTYKVLDILPSRIMSLEDYFELYPKGLVLSKSNKENEGKTYGSNPYHEYDDLNRTEFRHWPEIDDRLPPTERVVHVTIDGHNKLYPWSVIQKKGVINDEFQDEPLTVFYQSGVVSILDKENIEESKDVGTAMVYLPWIDGKLVSFKKSGSDFIDKQTSSVWNINGECVSGRLKGKKMEMMNHGQHFAFAWLSFYPDSEIYSE